MPHQLALFDAGMADRIYPQGVQEHRRAGGHSGVEPTPALLLNDTPLDVSVDFEKLEEAIRIALHGAPHAAANSAANSAIKHA